MTKNLAASVHARLMNRARADGRPFQELLQYYAMERFLFRLSRSPDSGRFVLKGALLMRAWDAPLARPTKDIDLLGHLQNSIDGIVAAISRACTLEVEADGMVFDPSTIIGQRIKEDAEYEGVRVCFVGRLGRARVPMQIDIGFGDAVVPRPQNIDYPTLLDFPAPRLAGYPRETVISEKYQAMVMLGIGNSRMKDFFDVWSLARGFAFDGPQLCAAIEATFRHRQTPLPPEPPLPLTEAFANDRGKQTQWSAFVRKGQLASMVPSLADVIDSLHQFLMPPTRALVDGEAFGMQWKAGGPWWRR